MKLAVLEVQESWRGPEVPVHAVYTGAGGGDCGFPFEEGDWYVVFAGRLPKEERQWLRESERALSTNVCLPTSRSVGARELIEWLLAKPSWRPAWRKP
jgi:hypothetical protein